MLDAHRRERDQLRHRKALLSRRARAVRLLDSCTRRRASSRISADEHGLDFGVGRREPVGGAHVAFECADREQVDAFYEAALASGGKDNGPPGLRAQYARTTTRPTCTTRTATTSRPSATTHPEAAGARAGCAGYRLTIRPVPWEPLTEEQLEIRELVRSLARERIAPRAAEIDASHEFPWDVVELFREHELFGLLFDERYGGTGTGTLLVARRDRGGLEGLRDERAHPRGTGARLARAEARRLGGAEGALPPEARLRASGSAAYALTEAGSGSDSAAMRTTARRDGDEYVLDGSKRFITNAAVANLYTVFAKTDPDAGHAGISAFVVESETPGFEVARLEPKMGIAGSTTGELVFDGARVPAANLARRGGRRLQGRDAHARPLATGRRGAGARDRAGRDRLRARLRAYTGDDGQADRRAPARRGEARGHGDADWRPRAASCTASGAWSTRAPPRTS